MTYPLPDFAPEPKARIGFLLLDTDHGSDREILSLVPADVAASLVRVRNYEGRDLRACKDEIVDAARLVYPDARVDAVGYACTSGSFGELGRLLGGRGPVVTTRDAVVAALAELSVSRIALLTPYTEQLNSVIEADIGAQGIEVRSSCALAIDSNDLIARLSQRTILDIAGRMLAEDAVQAILIGCNALRVASSIRYLEETYGKPVITSNQALVWRLLQISGYSSGNRDGGALLGA
ncbi:aspartate/glutamate racemase family protein [Amycolatopsis umgeniensis]|nr:aspartate/glutamate racemase family protein [Amycolatopsis umgeniensis]